MKRVVFALAALVVAGAVIAGARYVVVDESQRTSSREPSGPGSRSASRRTAAPVTALTPGLYCLTVHDLAANHNFHVIGPGVDVEVTSVPFIGTVTVPLKVKDGDLHVRVRPARDHDARDVRGTGREGQGQAVG